MLAFDVFLDDVRHPVMLLNVEHYDQGGVFQLGRRASFFDKSCHALRRFKPFPPRHFQGHEPIKLSVVSEIYDAEAAAAKDAANLVPANSLGHWPFVIQ